MDLLRGIAAVAVMLRHFPWPNHDVQVLPSSYLAVDLFFMLSGFVLTYTYGDRLADGMAVREFLWLRLLRLYPLYMIAFVLGAIAVVFLIAFGGMQFSGPKTFIGEAGSVVFGVFMLPTPGLFTDGQQMYPINSPSWSLFGELLVNLFFARVALNLDPRRLFHIILTSLTVLSLLVFAKGSADAGWTWADFGLGLARCSFGFFVGVALCRLRSRFDPPPASPLLATVLLLVPMAMPVGGSPLWTLASIVIVFPTVIWLACAPCEGGFCDPLYKFLGDLSYPIYVIQAPVLLVCLIIFKFAGGGQFGDAFARDLAIYLLATITAGYFCSRWLERPLRRWMSAMPVRRILRIPPTTNIRALR